MEATTAEFTIHLQRKLSLTDGEAKSLSKELIERFLPIKRYLQDFDASKCSPSPMIDEAWHELILFTKFYEKICGKNFIHHNPLGEWDSLDVKAERYARTRSAYEELFGTPPDDDIIWPVVYPGIASIDSNGDTTGMNTDDDYDYNTDVTDDDDNTDVTDGDDSLLSTTLKRPRQKLLSKAKYEIRSRKRQRLLKKAKNLNSMSKQGAKQLRFLPT